MEDSIKKFLDWKNMWSNPSSMGIEDYISFNIHPEDVLILGFLFFPKFIEFDGCIFFQSHFSEENYLSWRKTLGDDRVAIERVINHVHVYDVFDHFKGEVDDSVYARIGRLLQLSWSMYLRHEFPHKRIIVDYSNNENDYGPIVSVYQQE